MVCSECGCGGYRILFLTFVHFDLGVCIPAYMLAVMEWILASFSFPPPPPLSLYVVNFHVENRKGLCRYSSVEACKFACIVDEKF